MDEAPLTIQRSGDSERMATASSSLTMSTDALALVAAAVARLEDERKSVEPSRGALTTAAAPMKPEAPGRFSTMTLRLSRVLSCCATARAAKSLLPPGGNGTTIFINSGKSGAWPIAMGARTIDAAEATRNER